MARINVDHSKFGAAANEITEHVNTVKSQMSGARDSIAMLITEWRGKDYIDFKNQFEKLTADDSTYKKYIGTLEGYAEFLKFAAERYKKAQIDAYNNANGLPKW